MPDREPIISKTCLGSCVRVIPPCRLFVGDWSFCRASRWTSAIQVTMPKVVKHGPRFVGRRAFERRPAPSWACRAAGHARSVGPKLPRQPTPGERLRRRHRANLLLHLQAAAAVAPDPLQLHGADQVSRQSRHAPCDAWEFSRGAGTIALGEASTALARRVEIANGTNNPGHSGRRGGKTGRNGDGP